MTRFGAPTTPIIVRKSEEVPPAKRTHVEHEHEHQLRNKRTSSCAQMKLSPLNISKRRREGEADRHGDLTSRTRKSRQGIRCRRKARPALRGPEASGSEPDELGHARRSVRRQRRLARQ